MSQSSLVLGASTQTLVVNVRNFYLPRLFLYLAVRAAVLESPDRFEKTVKKLARQMRIPYTDADMAYLRQINTEMND